MSDADRGTPPRRSGPSRGKPGGDRPRQPPRPSSGRPPRADGDAPARGGDGERPRRPRADGDAPRRPRADGDTPPPRRPRPTRDASGRTPARSTGKGAGRGAPQGTGGGTGGRPERPWRFDDDRRPPRPPRTSDSAPRHDDPEIPEAVEAKQLDKVARGELRTLSKDNADWVARHLVMAGRLIDEDPVLAHRHALAAARRAGRISVVRETVAITAYATGDFALALRELRTYRRLSGRNDQLPLMVDSERGVGRPDRALELGRSVPRGELDPAVQVALAIAMSGARLDLGDPAAALVELQISQLDPERAFEWSPALFDAYATVLDELGRSDEAEQWWQRSDRATLALERATLPDGDDTVEIIDEEWDPDAPAH
jgi:hypothetical protein